MSAPFPARMMSVTRCTEVTIPAISTPAWFASRDPLATLSTGVSTVSFLPTR